MICLNNTLGYILQQDKAIDEMKKLGRVVIISVYGEQFSEALAKDYFTSIGLTIDHMENNQFVLKDFTPARRYTKEEIVGWQGRVTETPIGYFCSSFGNVY